MRTGKGCNRCRRGYGALVLGTQSTPARRHPEHGRALSHRTFLFLHRTQEYCAVLACPGLGETGGDVVGIVGTEAIGLAPHVKHG